MNNMGASLADVESQWQMLWVQSAIYLFTTCAVYKASILRSRQRVLEAWATLKQRRLRKAADKNLQ